MAEAIVSTTVEMLLGLLREEVNFLSGVRNQVQELQSELEIMQGFLKDADRRSYEEDRVRICVKKIRELAYRTEDVLETYAIKVESRKGKGIKSALKRSACILDKGVNLHKLGLEIGQIKTEIANITSSFKTYGIISLQSSNEASTNFLRKNFAHEIDEHFVGMKNDIDKLVSLMTDRDIAHPIISICGMGGLGKTTLAKQVFNDKVVRNRFECFAWVALSQQFDTDNVLKEILRQLDPRRDKDSIERMKYEALVPELHEFQKEKKCLVVLDDIWKTKDWDVLSRAFPTTSVDCRVLLTSRIQEVAEKGIPHKLNLFREEEGWQLLQKKAMNSTNARDSILEAKQEKLGKEMVRKCGYLPLAISVIGGILRKKQTFEAWEMVNKNIDSYLRCGDGVEDNYRVMQILTLSYDDLPYQLKPCLLYLAYYPEDAEIELRHLYMMWIAEGFILSKDRRGNESLMDVAERYITVLESRSLVQNVQLNEEIKSCRLHDLIRDLCLRKCEEEDFLKVIDLRGNKQLPKHDLNSLGGSAYRLVIYGSEVGGNLNYNEILRGVNKGTRTFSLRNFKIYTQISYELLDDLGNLRFLKVVTFEGLIFPKGKLLHKVIKKLIHLRCLYFEYCELDEVPSSVGMLTYLQTFHLKSHSSAVKIPNVFWKLKRLVHLVLIVQQSASRLRLDFPSRLETLIFHHPYPKIERLSKLINLSVFELPIFDNESLSLIIDFFQSNCRSMRDTRLSVRKGCDFIDGPILLDKLFSCRAIQELGIWNVRINELPKYESSGMLASSDLVGLDLFDNYIEEDPMPTLEKLPKLKHLTLSSRSFVGEELICSSTGFPNLKELELSSLPNLKRWIIQDGAMPSLSSVFITACFELEMIPTGMKFLKALKKLVTFDMPKEFNDRIRIVNGVEGADLHKVRHVSSVDIEYEENEGGSCA